MGMSLLQLTVLSWSAIVVSSTFLWRFYAVTLWFVYVSVDISAFVLGLSFISYIFLMHKFVVPARPPIS